MRDAARNGEVLRIIRLLRLLKLIRLFRASRILARWEAALSIPFAVRVGLKALVVTESARAHSSFVTVNKAYRKHIKFGC